MKTLILLATLLVASCGGTSTAPTPVAAAPPPTPPAVITFASRPTWVCSGQSNAVALCAPKGSDGLTTFTQDLYLAPYADVVGSWQGGARIALWDANGPLWPALQTALHAHPTVLIWWQGESDDQVYVKAPDFVPGQYLGQLRSLVARARAEAQNPNLLIMVVELGPTHWTYQVVADQRTFVATDPHAAFIPTEDLPYRDGDHMEDEGYHRLADRVARAAWVAGQR